MKNFDHKAMVNDPMLNDSNVQSQKITKQFYFEYQNNVLTFAAFLEAPLR